MVERDNTDALVRRLRALRTAARTEQHTALAREIATRMVARRGEIIDSKTGLPDWAGRTHAYREWASDLYRRAGYDRDPEARDRVQRVVRWHIGQIVRQTAPADELEAAGLQPATLVERNRELRAQRAALAEATRQQAAGRQSPVQWAGAALALVERITTVTVDDLTARDRRLLVAALDRVATSAARVAARMRADAPEAPAEPRVAE